MIKNVVLDMGNVLLDYNPDFSLNRFCSSEEEKEIIRKELFLGAEWLMADRGEIKDEDRFDLVKGRVPEKYHEALKNCCDYWTDCMVPLEGAREFCEKVKASGHGIYILSNASNSFYKYFPKFLPLDFFTGVFVSSNYLLLKPEVAIYKKFLEEYGLDGKDCLFVDDRMDNVQGAREAGMNTLQFKGDYEEVIRRLG
ncbi:MAG: HAD family phosphatase [Clostridiales bacterium]|nr:HAD family phosphatase [Clostridiales bacterium]